MPNWPAVKLSDSVVGVDLHTAALRLQQAGMTAMGAMQALQGQPVISATDRKVIAQILTAAVSHAIR